MRENFGKGIYPSLEERKIFALDACDYVEHQLEEICQKRNEEPDSVCAIISFSFVNTDLRDIFRERFPSAEWILIDTSEEECTKRINEREGHFYKGEITKEEPETTEEEPETEERDMSEWKFAPVEFPHLSLDGFNSVQDNAKTVVEKILEETE